MNLPVEEEKSALRRRALTARGAVGDAGAASESVCSRLWRLPELAGARRVLGYAATGSEVSIDKVLEDLIAADVAVCLPWVDGAGLRVSAVRSLRDDLVPGWRGVREPAEHLREPVRPARLDLLLVPGVAFDASGNRLGYGGGHFDRLLAMTRRGAVAVGVALDEQVVERVPHEPHDRPVHLLVTPTRTYRPPPRD